MQEDKKREGAGIPENAFRELKPGENYVPVMRPDRVYPEVTPYSVSVGLLMAVIFSAAAAYLGLKVGQVFEAAIPIAILAVGISGAAKRKNALGMWEDCEGYKVTYKNFPMGHGEKSVILLLCNGLEMTDDEMLAIRWHMGAWGINMNSYEDQRCYDTSRKLYPLVAIIQAADSLAASIMERSGEELDEL